MRTQRPDSTQIRRRPRTGFAMALVVGLATIATAKPTMSLDGTWTGSVEIGGGQSPGTASCALTQAGRTVSGTLTVDATGASGVFDLTGTLHGRRVLLKGAAGPRHVRWKGRFDHTLQSWRGPLVERGGGQTMHGTLALARDMTAGPTCGADYFASDVMPSVIEPICAQCHVPGGQAQAAAFKVTPGNGNVTARSAAKQVDPLDPTHSKLVAKPRGDVPHGGGKRILPGSTQEQVLLHWIALVTAPGCDLGTGGGSGGGGTGADLYAENCASCHGADARGLDGRPDIHCNRDISDAVRNGRSGPTGDMQAFTNLADADIAKIQAFLGGLCPVVGVTGAELFTSNCATCHGADARGVDGKPNIRCNRSIHDIVVAGGTGPSGTMPPFAMTNPEIALVQGFLVDLCPVGSATGDDLFAANCATCHGPGAIGTARALNVRCATRVADTMRVGRGARMPAFPGVAAAEVTSLQSYLTTICDGLGRPGLDLYVGNCATCHGTTAGGGTNGLGVHGPEVQCTGANDYSEKIRFGSDGMPAFLAFGTNDITAVVDYVHAAFCPGG